MIRGTTASFKFNIPYAYSELNAIQITFWQEGNNGTPEHSLPIVKGLASCTRGELQNEVCVKLNQEETLRFSDKLKARVQLRGLLNDGSAFASHEELITVYPICNDSIIGDWEEPEPVDDLVILDAGSI